ncbi:DUF4123 domain-containing protein [Actinobacillus equuli]|uniref:DUF4123 domain-containing protein n=1 Tax=Actinobacillus equuli TaxID=718 RepID=UPI002441A303|nr:DUF4123 domain-containing protein [Actinobacillus equuli]WGE43112.1 DUF4123 domain-containing protein [Actinobacillus equuli subsp. haemolyticus]WGE46902.1 DUF4123 domain-containing protein [Actinobacillus equuli subsp. haemolyticus]
MPSEHQHNMKLYGLFDAALMPQIWFNLDGWQLNYVPLYRGNYQPIAEAIPYLIELDKSSDETAVSELLTNKAYQQGLLIFTELNLDELVERLAYFYHIRNKQNEPCLRRFFDLRIFKKFLSTLPLVCSTYLFDNQTVFCYFESEFDYYNVISYQDDQICWLQTEKPEFMVNFI